MIFSLNNVFLNKVLIFITILLTACDAGKRYNCQIDVDKYYLNSTPLHTLRVPPSITLPNYNSDYNVKVINKKVISDEVNIIPPLQNNSSIVTSSSQPHNNSY